MSREKLLNLYKKIKSKTASELELAEFEMFLATSSFTKEFIISDLEKELQMGK